MKGGVDMNVICNPEVKKIHVNDYDLIHCDIEDAKEYYHTVLKWDSLMNYRSIQIIFDHTLNLPALERNKMQIQWFQHLIHEIPVYLYYLTPKSFIDALLSFSIIFYESETFVQDLEKITINDTLLNYIAEEIEDLYLLNLAPVTLVATILEDLKKIIRKNSA